MTSITTKLRTLLNQICEERNYFSPASISHLRDDLQESRDIFVKLLDIPPKNAEHRKTIQSGEKENRTVHLHFVLTPCFSF